MRPPRSRRPWLVSLPPLLLAVCTGSCAEEAVTRRAPPIAVTPITACPDGAVLVGEAPPRGLRQRCQRSDQERHGASRDWYESRRERTYTEWWEGKKHGRFTLWYETGKVRSQGHHRHGAPAGAWTYYAEDGTVLQHQTFAVPPPADDWLAQALAGRPPAAEEGGAAATEGAVAATEGAVATSESAVATSESAATASGSAAQAAAAARPAAVKAR